MLRFIYGLFFIYWHHNDQNSSQTSGMGLILKLLSSLDKHSQQFFDVCYTMIFHTILFLNDIDVNAMKVIFKSSGTHSLIVFLFMSFTGKLLHSIPIICIKRQQNFSVWCRYKQQKACKESKGTLGRINSKRHFLSADRRVGAEIENLSQTGIWMLSEVCFNLCL